MFDKVTIGEMQAAGWSIVPYQGSVDDVEAQRIMGELGSDSSTVTGVVKNVLGLGVVGGAACVHPLVGLGLLGGGILSKAFIQVFNKFRPHPATQYLFHTKRLFYIEQFENTLSAKNRVITKCFTPDTTIEKCNEVVALWEAASPFLDAIDGVEHQRNINCLRQCRKTLLDNCSELQTQFTSRAITQPKYALNYAEQVAYCLGTCLKRKSGFIIQMRKKEEELKNRHYLALTSPVSSTSR